MGVVGLFRRLKGGICWLFARFFEDLFWLFRRFGFPDGNFWYVAGRWMEEPIGVLVPFVALVILLLAPQMPDMFVGISGSTWYDITWAEIEFAASAAVLGFSSWYWTHAALAAPFKEDDTTERGTAQHPLQGPTGAVTAERPIAVEIFFALPLVLVILLHVPYLNDIVSKPIDNIINLCISTIFVALFAGGWWLWYVDRIPLSSSVPATNCRLLDEIAEKREAAREKAPRIAIVFALLIALSPVIAVIFRLIRAGVDADQNLSELNYQGIPWFGSFFGAILVFAVYGFAIKRMDWQWCRAASRAEWLWRATAWPPLGWPTAIIAAAPFGWIFAASLFLFSIVGIVFTAFNFFHYINAPSAALLSLALAVPIFVLLLAFSRDLVYFSLPVTLALWRWIRISGKIRHADTVTNASLFDGLVQHYTLRPDRHLLVWSARLGFVILVIVMFGPSLTGLGDHLYEVRMTGNTLVEAVQGSPSDQQEQITPARPSADPPADLPALRRPNFEEALEAWYRERVSGHPADRPMPVIIVAAEGGASRAAVWMLRAMKLLDEETKLSDKELRGDFGRYLFGIVGVSGGSLGAVTYLQAAGNDGTAASGLDWSKKEVENGLSAMAKSDLLSASITTYFLNDSVGLIATPIWVAFGLPDRAKALEAAFELHWRDDWLGGDGNAAAQATTGLIKLQQSDSGLPHLFLVGTDIETGRRLITSTIRFGPENDLFAASDDLLGIIGHDIPAATAVTNSARFPFISPTGRFWHRNDPTRRETPRQVVDGGYFENYGARTAAELSRKILQMGNDDFKYPGGLAPIVVVISNDGDGARTTLGDVSVHCKTPDKNLPPAVMEERTTREQGLAPELAAPLLGLYATRSAHGQDALHIVRRLHCPAETGGLKRMIHIALPMADPEQGESAPLNWVLNDQVRHFLIETAPIVEFNKKQANDLKKTLRDGSRTPAQANTVQPR